MERQHTNAHCSLESEREQKNTLTLKVTTLEGELSTLKNQYRKLEAQRQEFTEETERKVSNTINRIHKNYVSNFTIAYWSERI